MGEGGERGGLQRIPRPASARAGGPPRWAHLGPEQRRFSLDDVRRSAASLPAPQRPVVPATARPAAVLIPVLERDGEAQIVLTKRPDTMPSHQGEIAFPGGKLDEALDHSLRDAALREAEEEIGLDPALVEIVGELDTLTTVAGRFALTPFLGLVSGSPELSPHETEVVSVFDVAISDLLDELAYREERWDIPASLGPEAGMDRPIHFFELRGETVWGATARILVGFLEHLTRSR